MNSQYPRTWIVFSTKTSIPEGSTGSPKKYQKNSLKIELRSWDGEKGRMKLMFG